MSNWFKDIVLNPVGDLIDGFGWLHGKASALAINAACGTTRNRPHPWSTVQDDYISWDGLTDRTYLARHLPAADTPIQPDVHEVSALFARPAGKQRLSSKSTCLLPAFAQYLTDGFIRTIPYNLRKTTTNHDIDLCQLYGRTRKQTLALRLKAEDPGRRGRLKSELDEKGEEYPLLLYPNGARTADPQFEDLDTPLFMPRQPERTPTEDWPPPHVKLGTIFAVGGDRVNSTPFTAMMNTLFLREHNRLARRAGAGEPAAGTTSACSRSRATSSSRSSSRSSSSSTSTTSPRCHSASPSTPRWCGRPIGTGPNWITVEFSLLYRWHSLMPDAIRWPTGDVPLGQFGLDNTPLLGVGLEAAFAAAAAQPAGELGALNTAEPLMQVEWLAVDQARKNRLDTYNNYRRAFGLDPAERFEDISGSPAVRGMLEELYSTRRTWSSTRACSARTG